MLAVDRIIASTNAVENNGKMNSFLDVDVEECLSFFRNKTANHANSGHLAIDNTMADNPDSNEQLPT